MTKAELIEMLGDIPNEVVIVGSVGGQLSNLIEVEGSDT